LAANEQPISIEIGCICPRIFGLYQ